MADLESLSVAGVWLNEAGSSLILIENGEALAGTYRTAVGAADPGRDYPLVGWRNGRCLGFTASWAPESDSVTAWTALLHGDPEPDLHAVWTLVRSRTLARSATGVVDRAAAPWEAFSVQSSRFRR